MAKISCPTEHEEQIALIQWRDWWQEQYPQLAMLAAIPMGGYRAKRTAITMRQEGAVKGFPDLGLFIPSGGYHGLFLEMKRLNGGRATPEQKDWLHRLSEQGYRAEVAKGAVEAHQVIQDYLGIPLPGLGSHAK